MKQFFFALFAALCVFSVAAGIWLLCAPPARAQEAPASGTAASPASDGPVYYLRDDGGRVAVYASPDSTTPLQVYEIYVNLLPENDALRLKSGIAVTGTAALERLLADLGG